MPNVLTPDQIEAYHRNGMLFPLPALSSDEVASFRAFHDQLCHLLARRLSAAEQGQCHLHFKWACDLATHPKVLDAVEDIIGPDILIHSSTVFSKYADDGMYVSWHQDSPYWGLSEPRLVSAWIALTDSILENGCLRVLPGTHTRMIDHVVERHEKNMLATGLTISEDLDLTKAVDVCLKAGEMSFHHAHIVHGSNPNTARLPRIGFAVRYMSTCVKQLRGHHGVILARGRDNFGYYQLQDKPTGGLEQGLIAQRMFQSDPKNNF